MLHIRPMTGDDLALGQRLKEQAGWNQTATDWQRALALQPDGCFVAEWDQVAVGTTTTCLFGRVAWVALVLVDPALRGRGIGTALMRRALEFLDEQGVHCIRLDATPLGRPVYEKLGFVTDYLLDRYEGTLPGAVPVPAVAMADIWQTDALVQLDRAVTGTDRGKFLRCLFGEGEAVRVVGEADRIDGFLAARRGARAVQIGPCVADSEAGPLLLADAWHRYAGRCVFVDVPADQAAAIASARSQGLTVQRPLTRMFRGDRPTEQREYLWASAGPEKG